MTGTIALVGGGEFTPACTIDRDLLEAAGTDRVLVLPTGAAYEHPDRLVAAAAAWFEGLGARAEGLPVLARPDASRPELVDAVRTSRFTYLAGGSPMHLRSVLKETPVWEAIVEAVNRGGVVAGAVGRGHGAHRSDGRPPRRRLHPRARPAPRSGRHPGRRPVVARAPPPHEGAVARVPAGRPALGLGAGARAGRHVVGPRRGRGVRRGPGGRVRPPPPPCRTDAVSTGVRPPIAAGRDRVTSR